MMGKITASCGHEIADACDYVTVYLKTETCDSDGFHKAFISASYCSSCAAEVRTWDDFLPSREAAEKWLDEE